MSPQCILKFHSLYVQVGAYSLCLSCMKAFTEEIWQEHVQLMRSNGCYIKFRRCFLLGFIYLYLHSILSHLLSLAQFQGPAPFLISQPIVTVRWLCEFLVNVKVAAINLTLLLEENLRWEIWQQMTGIFLGLAQKKV